MDYRLMRGYIDSAVLLCTGESEHVVIFIDGTAYRTKGIMAVGQYIRHRELLQS